MTNLTISQLQEEAQSALATETPDLPADKRTELVNAIARRLAAQTLLSSGVPASDIERRIDKDLLSKVSYAIPDDELNLLPTVVKAVISAFLTGPADAIADLVSLLIRYRSLRVEISADEAAVLRALRDAKTAGKATLAPAEIKSCVENRGLTLHESVNSVLASLVAKKTDKATLVSEVEGRWAIGDV